LGEVMTPYNSGAARAATSFPEPVGRSMSIGTTTQPNCAPTSSILCGHRPHYQS
jgi:hypothetical protein